jgi:hypothetical protein
MFAAAMHAPERVQVLPAWGIRAIGLFVPVVREMYEMRYQYDRDYVFDSSKFVRRFNYTPTSNNEAVRLTVRALREPAAPKGV